MSSTGSRLSDARVACSSVSLPFSASFARPRRAFSAPLCSASGNGSYSSVRAPERAASWAMPLPIVPAPSTPITDAARLTWESAH